MSSSHNSEERPEPAVFADDERILNAMPVDDWVRTQWVARVAFGLGTNSWQPEFGIRTLRALRRLKGTGKVSERMSSSTRRGSVGGLPVEVEIPRSEWRREVR